MNALTVAAKWALSTNFDPISISTHQRCLRTHASQHGAVAFYRGRHGSLTLGPPVAAPEDSPFIAREFLQAEPGAAFFYLTSEQADVLAPLGLNAFPMGVDFLLDLPQPNWPRAVDSAHRKAVKVGLTLVELSGAELATFEPQMRAIQRSYLERQEVKHEMQFLTRPCEFAAERRGRTFGLFQRGAMLGFVVVDPYITSKDEPGVLLNLFRVGPTKLWGVYFAVVKLLAEQLAGEGVRELSLGFLPLAEGHAPSSWFARAQVSVLRRIATTSPYLRGLAHLKESFTSARRVTRWVLTPRSLIIRDLLTLFEAMGVYRQAEG